MSVQEAVWMIGVFLSGAALICATILFLWGHRASALLIGAFNLVNLGALIWWAVR